MPKLTDYYRPAFRPQRRRLFLLLLAVCVLGLILQISSGRLQLADAASQQDLLVDQQNRRRELLEDASMLPAEGALPRETILGDILSDVETGCQQRQLTFVSCRQLNGEAATDLPYQVASLEIVIDGVADPTEFLQELEGKWRPVSHLSGMRWDSAAVAKRLTLKIETHYYQPGGEENADSCD
jgi:hypothetical protein